MTVIWWAPASVAIGTPAKPDRSMSACRCQRGCQANPATAAFSDQLAGHNLRTAAAVIQWGSAGPTTPAPMMTTQANPA